MVKEVICPGLQCQYQNLCVNLDSANHLLPLRMAKQRWHLCLRNNITFPVAGLGSGLSTSQVIQFAPGPFCEGMSFLLNVTTSILLDMSFKSKEGRRMRFLLWHKDVSFRTCQKLSCAPNYKDTSFCSCFKRLEQMFCGNKRLLRYGISNET